MRKQLLNLFLNLFSQYKTEIIIFVSIFVIHFLIALIGKVMLGDHVFVSYSDAYYFYLQSAKNLIHAGTLSIASETPFYPDAYHTPLYPLFLAALLYIKLPLLAIIAVQDCIIALTATVVYRIGIILFTSRSIALFGALAMGLEPMAIYWGNILVSDSLFAFFFVFALYCFLKKNYPVFGLLMGLATLTRPIALYFFILFIAMIPIRYYLEENRSRQSLKKLLCRLASAIIIFGIILAPWLIRNKVQFNTAKLSMAGWYEFYIAVGLPFAQVEHVVYPSPPTTPKINADQDFTRFDFKYEQYYKLAFLNVVRTHPMEYVKFHVSRMWTALWNHGYSYLAHDVIGAKISSLEKGAPGAALYSFVWIGNILWILFYIMAIYNYRRKELRIWLIFFGVLLLSNIMSAGVIVPEGGEMSRYMLPFAPIIFLFAGAGIENFFNTIYETKQKSNA